MIAEDAEITFLNTVGQVGTAKKKYMTGMWP